MSKYRDLATVAALCMVLIAGGCLVAQTQPTGYETGMLAETWAVDDRPLLTAEQAVQARDGGTVAFECAGKSYVVAGMPAEYTREDRA